MKLKELRIINHLSQEEMAQKLDISQKTYSNYENNLTQPRLETIIKTAQVFNVSIEYLLEIKPNNIIDTSLLSNKRKELIDQVLKLDEKFVDRMIGRFEEYTSNYQEPYGYPTNNQPNLNNTTKLKNPYWEN